MSLFQHISNTLAKFDRHPRRCMWGMTLFTIVYYLLISLQGFDFADEGFSLTFYQNIYKHPNDVEYMFLYYLTGVAGGIWEMIFGNIGNYGYRILFAVVSGGIVMTTFAILRPYFKTSTITLSTLACTLYPGLCLYYFNHDCLTALLFLLTVYSMMRGIDGKHLYWYSVGFFLVLATLTRIPNITTFVLIFIPLVDAIYHGNYHKALCNILRIIGGSIIASTLMLIIMLSLKHIQPFHSALQSLFIMGSDTSDTHNITNLLGHYLYTYKGIFKSALYGLLAFICYAITVKYIKIKGIHIIGGVICIAFIYSMLSRNFYAMWSFITGASIIYTMRHHSNNKRLILGLSALIMLIVIPIGGDSYGNICYSCTWLGMPLLIDMFRNPIKWDISYKDEYGRNIHINTNTSVNRQLCMIATISFLLFTTLHSKCYFDDGSRWHKKHLAQTNLATTITSQERVQVIDSIVTHTMRHRSEGNYLLVFDNLPMLHYLTKMQPYLGSPWSTFWGVQTFEYQLFKSENSPKNLPLIAIPRFHYKDLSPINYFDVKENPDMQKKAAILFDFMQRHGYTKVYQDDYIILYNPT